MIDDRLTKCERGGNIVSFSNPTPVERDAIMLVYSTLKAQKHGVVCDEVQHGDGGFELRIHHYLTCVVCGEMK